MRASKAFLPLVACGVLLAGATLGACRPSSSTEGAPDATASPQASAMPAPLTSNDTLRTSTSASPVTPEGGPPPTPLRGDAPLPPDTLARDVTGYTLSALLRPGELVGPPRAPEVNTAGIEAARKKTELRLGIELGVSRMRLSLLGHGFVLPPDSELRARSDRYGHVVVWDNGQAYRPIGPGALRALLGERRLDVAPITSAEVVTKDETGKRIGIRTRKVEVTTRAARSVWEIGRLAELGDGGVLLCRFLLDLMNAPPGTQVCGLDEVPMRVELRWTGQGSLGFELTGVLKKNDLSSSGLLVPPANASFAASPLEANGVEPMLSAPELAALRTGPVDVPPPPAGVSEGLSVQNATDELRLVFVDGVSAAWVAPGARALLSGLQRGRYNIQLRTFLGDASQTTMGQVVPGVIQVGTPADAGTKPIK
ncbi:hypothetical protein [Labilithrix luteola]|nr:hypothetical protein [Labilithrix luteola]